MSIAQMGHELRYSIVVYMRLRRAISLRVKGLSKALTGYAAAAGYQNLTGGMNSFKSKLILHHKYLAFAFCA